MSARLQAEAMCGPQGREAGGAFVLLAVNSSASAGVSVEAYQVRG